MKSPKKKHNKALWVKCYPDQAKSLRPENTARGGIKSRATAHEIKMAVYRAIRLLYLAKNPECECCMLINESHGRREEATTIHHTRGKNNWLLIDVRFFKSACLGCHQWIDANRDKARKLGLLCDKGNWNKIT